MGRRFLLSVIFPDAHFVDKTFPCFYHASLQLREGIVAQPIEVRQTGRVRAIVGTMDGWSVVKTRLLRRGI